jgi:hypothetical protein
MVVVIETLVTTAPAVHAARPELDEVGDGLALVRVQRFVNRLHAFANRLLHVVDGGLMRGEALIELGGVELLTAKRAGDVREVKKSSRTRRAARSTLSAAASMTFS